jgi:hypothetical protein
VEFLTVFIFFDHWFQGKRKDRPQSTLSNGRGRTSRGKRNRTDIAEDEDSNEGSASSEGESEDGHQSKFKSQKNVSKDESPLSEDAGDNADDSQSENNNDENNNDENNHSDIVNEESDNSDDDGGGGLLDIESDSD